MITIKFRGKFNSIRTTVKPKNDDSWVYGDLVRNIILSEWKPCDAIYDGSYFVPVNPVTVGQFTGLLDKNGKEIYEGDIVRYYETRSVCINPDCEPYNFIYNDVLIEKLEVINFVDGMFSVEDESNPLCWQGFNDLEELRELLSANEENEYTDVDGNTIDETKLGIEVIGNIHDNPKLLKGVDK